MEEVSGVAFHAVTVTVTGEQGEKGGEEVGQEEVDRARGAEFLLFSLLFSLIFFL